MIDGQPDAAWRDRMQRYARRLIAVYGAERAREIYEGKDADSLADEAAWRRCGGRAVPAKRWQETRWAEDDA